MIFTQAASFAFTTPSLHNAAHPAMDYAAIRVRVAELCRTDGIEFVDLGEPSSDYRLFKDPYHMNDDGKQWLSQRLAAWWVKPVTRADSAGRSVSPHE